MVDQTVQDRQRIPSGGVAVVRPVLQFRRRESPSCMRPRWTALADVCLCPRP